MNRTMRGSLADAQVAEPPGVTGILDVPAAADVELFDLAAGIDQQRPAGVPVAGTRPGRNHGYAAARVLVPVQQRGDAGAGGNVTTVWTAPGAILIAPSSCLPCRAYCTSSRRCGARPPRSMRSWPGTASSS